MKSILAILLFSLSTSVATAQFHIGVKGGVGVSDVHWDQKLTTDDTKLLTSIHLGIFSKLKILDRLSVIPELQYITKGYSYDGSAAFGVEAFKFKVNYLELPVLVNYQVVKWIAIEAGPSFAIKTKAKTTSDSRSNDFINDYVEPLDFGILGGFRFSLTDKLSITARYNYGLTPVLSSKYSSMLDPNANLTIVKAYNRSMQFSVSYQIR